MPRMLALRRHIVLPALIVLFCLAAGCSGPKQDAEQFVGTWVLKGAGDEGMILRLRPDGTGDIADPPDPHVETVNWLVRGDELILAPRDGGPPRRYGYRFPAPDELVLTVNDSEIAFARSE